MEGCELVLLMIEIIVVYISIRTGSINDKLGKIESILEDINAKLGEKEED